MNHEIFFFFYNMAHMSRLSDSLIFFLAAELPWITIISVGIFLLFHGRKNNVDEGLSAVIKRRKEVFFVLFSGFISWLVAVILKMLLHVERPFNALPNIHPLFNPTDSTIYSFPSEHAAFFTAIGLSVFFINKKAGSIFLFFALLICIARIMAGVHFPADILFGIILGLFLTFILNIIIYKHKNK